MYENINSTFNKKRNANFFKNNFKIFTIIRTNSLQKYRGVKYFLFYRFQFLINNCFLIISSNFDFDFKRFKKF